MDQPIAVAIIKNPSSNKVLLTSRIGNESQPDSDTIYWLMPGTKYNEGDDVKQLLAKAVKEKTGLSIEVGELISERKHSEIEAKRHYYYACKLSSNKIGALQRVSETQQIKWVEPSQLINFYTTSMDENVAKYLGIEPFPAK